MADYGMKATLPGYDVSTATAEQLAITSKYASPKIKLGQSPAHFGIYEHTFASNPTDPGDTTLLTVAHGYSHTPSCFCLIKFTVGAEDRTNTLPSQYGIANQLYATTDTTNFKIILSRAGGGGDLTGLTWTFKYYIFVDDGA